mgnify:CR=1 FL=1
MVASGGVVARFALDGTTPEDRSRELAAPVGTVMLEFGWF